MSQLNFLPTRERFLPFKPDALLEHVLRDQRLDDHERGQMRALFEMVEARFHFEFRQQLEELKTLYDAFDPDRDTLPLAEHTPQSLDESRSRLKDDFRKLLIESNYVELSEDEIRKCIETDHPGPLAVVADLGDYRDLCVFYRGVKPIERPRHWWQRARWQAAEKVQAFSRAALLIRTMAEPQECIYLKVFKNVVAADLEMLLPHIRLHMRWLEKAKLGSTVAGGIGTACWKAFTAAVLSPWVFLSLLSAFVGAAAKGFFTFMATKTHYMQALSANLYFQNLGNNTSALALLVDTAEAEESKELLLAYYMLYVERDRDFTQPELDARIEKWLAEQFGLDVDFEVDDAVRKLREKGLLAELPPTQSSGGLPILKVYDLPSSLRRLDEIWDDYFQYNGHTDPADDRLAGVPPDRQRHAA